MWEVLAVPLNLPHLGRLVKLLAVGNTVKGISPPHTWTRKLNPFFSQIFFLGFLTVQDFYEKIFVEF